MMLTSFLRYAATPLLPGWNIEINPESARSQLVGVVDAEMPCLADVDAALDCAIVFCERWLAQSRVLWCRSVSTGLSLSLSWPLGDGVVVPSVV